MILPRRSDMLARLARERFDLLVIGGGINGAGIARDAAQRGLRVALVDAGDWAQGTSSRSSRLVHGGVRYLEHGYLHLVFEASRERRTLLTIAPHLVRPLAFTWPVYHGARIPRWKLGAGLWLYDLLAAFGNVGRHRRLSATGVLAREPKLRADGLAGGATYWDAATHDSRLTWANVQDAALLGACVANHCAVTSLVREGGRITGAEVTDHLGGQRFVVQAAGVVNAAGPWHDAVARLDDATHPTGVLGTRGTHVAVERARLGNVDAVTIVSAVDGRVMFALPAGPHAIIGTTDTAGDAGPDAVRATEADIAYLLESANRAFPDARLARTDVVSAWAGIRPLIASGNAGEPASASREHRITTSASGMTSVTGGKLTTYRAMSAEVVSAAAKAIGAAPRASGTALRALPGGAPHDDQRPARSVAEAVAWREALEAEAAAGTGAADVGRELVHAYGSAWRDVWALGDATPALRERVAPGLPWTWASVAWAARAEMAVTVADALIRRTTIAFQLRDHGRGIALRAAELMGRELGWTRAGVDAAVGEYADEVGGVLSG
jgi:glycerol-3-phosphate dehydrogenase